MPRTFDEGNARDGVPVSFLQGDELFGESSKVNYEELKPTEVQLLQRQLQETLERRLETLMMCVQLREELTQSQDLLRRVLNGITLPDALRLAIAESLGFGKGGGG